MILTSLMLTNLKYFQAMDPTLLYTSSAQYETTWLSTSYATTEQYHSTKLDNNTDQEYRTTSIWQLLNNSPDDLRQYRYSCHHYADKVILFRIEGHSCFNLKIIGISFTMNGHKCTKNEVRLWRQECLYT